MTLESPLDPSQLHPLTPNMDELCNKLSKSHITALVTRYANGESVAIVTARPRVLSLATLLPVELIEIIFSHFHAKHLLTVAAAIPKLYRGVLENSLVARTKLESEYMFNESFDVGMKRRLVRFEKGFCPGMKRHRILLEEGTPGYDLLTFRLRNELYTFSTSFDHGVLYGGTQPDGFIFAPQSRKPKLRIINPRTMQVKYHLVGPAIGTGLIILYDFEGKLVCQRTVNENNADALWRYVFMICGGEYLCGRPCKAKKVKRPYKNVCAFGGHGGL